MTEFWVFGYGSLIWRPGFSFVERRPARLHGAHRALCVYSWVHRGTREHPGLVLGLDRGGACRGIAYRVAAADWEAVHAYLRGREQVTPIYRERYCTIEMEARTAQALTYIVDRGNGQYAGKLDEETQFRIVSGAAGQSGPNRDYVLSAARHLAELGIRDAGLTRLAARLAPA
jgi:cation transport protein ChaC